MKRIRVLAALVVIVFLFVELGDAVRGFMDGARDEHTFVSSPIELSLKAVGKTELDSVFCPQQNTYAYCQVKSVSVDSDSAGIKPSGWRMAVSILTIPFVLFTLYGFYCLFRLVTSLTRGEVFTIKNVYRMRCFVYGVILVSICMETDFWLHYMEAASQVQFPGYEVVPYVLKGDWLFYVILALLTEIFAVGVKIKQDQDLTI